LRRRRNPPGTFTQFGSSLSPLEIADLKLRQFIWGEVKRISQEEGLVVREVPDLNLSEFIEGLIEEEDRFKSSYDKGGDRSMSGRWGAIHERVAKVWLDERGVLCARFAFDKPTISEIRIKILRGKKMWREESNIWEFSAECIDVLIPILEANFDKVVDLTKETNLIYSSEAKDSLLSLLDAEDMSKILRLLSLKYHPDINKDGGEKMAEINSIFARCKKERGMGG
jgi:hypothetical protein